MKLLLVCLLISVQVTARAQSDIRKVDFKNFTYQPFCAGDETQTIVAKDGEFARQAHMDGYVDRFYFNVSSVTFGDLNSDGVEDAVALTVCNTGGTGNFSEGFVYTIKSGRPFLTGRIPGGDRAYGGLRSATVVDGILVVESNDVGELGGACCPEYVITTTYRVTGGKLTPTGAPTRRELFPKQRLKFAPGSSAKRFTVRLAPEAGKRYVLRARAGQTLTVTLNAPNATLRLLDEALVTEGENSFTAKLPKNGDFTFEIRNFGEAALDVTVTVKIR